MRSRAAWICSLLVGCTFGGSEEDPTGGLSSIEDPVMDGGVVVSDGGGGGVDATVRRDASIREDAGGAADAGVVLSDAGVTNSCKPAKAVAVCDPVKNTGCEPFGQCDLNPEATAQSGRCVSWFPGLFGCSANGLSTSCGAGEACIESACTKLCYCDADCGTGKKCSGTAPGPTGPVKVCR